MESNTISFKFILIILQVKFASFLLYINFLWEGCVSSFTELQDLIGKGPYKLYILTIICELSNGLSLVKKNNLKVIFLLGGNTEKFSEEICIKT